MDDLHQQIANLSGQLKALRVSNQQMLEEIARIEVQLLRLKQRVPEVPGVLNDMPAPPVIVHRNPAVPPSKPAEAVKSRQSAEDFIGTNLISKIGILITIIGIFIGAKYAIDKDLVSPLMRIIGGYCCAALLIGTGLWLKQKYLQFSAVLVGGGTAVAYFITYTGYVFYDLFPQSIAFLLMLLTTAATIALALWYNQKVIALLGQVGAYAIPLLLSNGGGKLAILFTYISIINAGLMVLAFKRQWKLLYHAAFIITWMMYLLWVVAGAEALNSAGSLLFLFINYVTFLITFLVYKIRKSELYKLGEMIILLSNAFLFFLLGYQVVGNHTVGVNPLTVFTLGNAALHCITAYTINQLRPADTSVAHFLAGLGLLFFSVAIPVKLDGNWVTLLWALEVTILVAIAIKNNRQLYYQIAAILMVVALLSLLQDRTGVSETNRLLSKYASLAGIAIAWFALNKGRKQFPFHYEGTALFSAIFNITLLCVICSEYLYWLSRAGSPNQYKLGLTIIIGGYALVILFLGLIKNIKYLRVGAITLFALTIGKLFVYDLVAMSTITKTVVMILLGVLLLLASFLYHKYKPVLIAKEAAERNEQNEQGG